MAGASAGTSTDIEITSGDVTTAGGAGAIATNLTALTKLPGFVPGSFITLTGNE
jgi:hypothetical protein